MGMSLDAKRLNRLWRLVRSRWQDYSGLAAANSVQATRDWVGQNRLLGFNGNGLRAKVIEGLARVYNSTHFIETGTYHGATAICARKYLNRPVLTCELSLSNYVISRCVTHGMCGVSVYHLDSVAFLEQLIDGKLSGGVPACPLFYLDAHEGENPDSLPLLEELEVISRFSSFIVIIDDFQVPFEATFAHGRYAGISLSLALVRDKLLRMGVTKVFFPGYPPRIETGYRSGYVVFWRSVDEARQLAHFPLNLLRRYSLCDEL